MRTVILTRGQTGKSSFNVAFSRFYLAGAGPLVGLFASGQPCLFGRSQSRYGYSYDQRGKSSKESSATETSSTHKEKVHLLFVLVVYRISNHRFLKHYRHYRSRVICWIPSSVRTYCNWIEEQASILSVYNTNALADDTESRHRLVPSVHFPEPRQFGAASILPQ